MLSQNKVASLSNSRAPAWYLPLTLILAALTATAQEQSAGLEEIVVTAQKRSESLQTVPISVTAITPAQLQAQHIYDLTQLNTVAPSLQIESFNAAVGAQVFAVRGVGTLSFSSALESSVGLVIDGVAMGRPEFGIMDFSDIAQVEVLNGPQGMLFGKNATAGLVNITTAKPTLGQLQVSAHAEYGRMTTPGGGNETLDQVAINLPIGDTSALRLNGFVMSHPPLVEDVFPNPGSDYGQKEEGGRLKYLWKPTDNLELLFAADYATSTGEGPGATSDRSLSPGSPFAGLDAAVGITPGPNNSYLSSDGKTNNHFHVGGAQSNVTYSFDDGYSLTNILAVRLYRNDQIFDVDDHQINIFNVNNSFQNYRQITEELRLASPKSQLIDYQVGLYYYNVRLEGHGMLTGDLGGGPPPPPFTGILGINNAGLEHTYSYALFGEATYHVTDRARLTVGLRETDDRANNSSFSDQGGNLFSLGAPGVNTNYQTLSHTNLSGRAIGQFDFAEGVMGYVSASRGYKGPGFNTGFSVDLPIVRPEIVTDYEVGVKSSFLDRRMTLNVAAFTEKFQDFQAQSYDVAQQSYLTLNAGELSSRGFEGSLDYLPIQSVRLTGAVSYVDAYFKSYQLDQCYAGQPSCSAQGTNDSTGNRLPNAPRWSGTLAAAYNHPMGDRLKFDANATAYMRSWVNFSSNADPHTVQAAYTLLSTNVGISSRDDRWRVSAFCRNCADRRFVAYVEANPLSPADYGQQFSVDSFRTIGFAVDLKY